MKTKFYQCPVCGNLIVKIEDSGVIPHCCGEEMQELQPGIVDASREKHVPSVKRKDSCTTMIEIGSEPHPMIPSHHIDFIWMETENGAQLRYLSPEAPARAEFFTCFDKAATVYEYCNLHGLWKTEL